MSSTISAKQVMDIRKNKDGISTPESNEQQRKWNNDFLQRKAEDSTANYDPNRVRLNFEVVKGGKVQPIDTSKTIAQKMEEILAARGIPNPNTNPNVRRKQNILAQFIFGGNRERMHEIAFGDQKVDLSKGADNSNITRSKDIEKWAVDVYRFAARKFGEENIVSFYVHLDEINPHIHCAVLPVDPDRNRISWKYVFGENRIEERERFSQLHTDFHKEVNEQWGLNRGNSKEETKAKHRSMEQYKSDLVKDVQQLEDTKEGLQKQIAKEERKLKSFTTMIENLQERKTAIENEIDQIAKKFGEEGADSEQLADRLKKLRNEMESVQQKLADRQKMLDDTTALLVEAKEKLTRLKEEEARTSDRVDVLKREHAQMAKFANDDIMRKAEHEFTNIRGAYYKMLNDSVAPVIEHLDRDQRDVLHDSGYYDLKEDSETVINCATLLAINFIKEAITYAESHGGGGGGGSSLSGWGRKKDDDDERWWQRCIRQAAAMMKPARKRSRGR